MAQTITVKARGLSTSPSNIDTPASGRLTQADNVVVGRDGVWEPRRGVHTTATFSASMGFDRTGIWGDYLVLHDQSGSVWLYDVLTAATGVVSGVFLPPSGGQFRVMESNGNAYLSALGSVYRLDRFPEEAATYSYPLPAGMPPGLDASGSLQVTDGAAVQGDSQVAYRFTFLTTDANGKLIEGAPSGRGVVVSRRYTGVSGSVQRSGSVVFVTASNDLTSGESISLQIGNTDFPAITAPVLAANPAIFSYVQTGSAVTSSTNLFYTRSTRNAVVGSTIPSQLRSIPAGRSSTPYRFRVYRSAGSPTALDEPTDDLQLVYEGTVPGAVSAIHLERHNGTVFLTSSGGTGNIIAGELVDITPGVSGSASTNFVLVGVPSPSASAWYQPGSSGSYVQTALTASSLYRVASGTDRLVAVGRSNQLARSFDGVEWSVVSTPTSSFGQVTWADVAYSPSLDRFVAIGYKAGSPQSNISIMYSQDGAVWTEGLFDVNLIGRHIIWDGSRFMATVNSTNASNYYTAVITSSNGVVWSSAYNGPSFIPTPPGYVFRTPVDAHLAYNGAYYSMAVCTTDIANVGQGTVIIWNGTTSASNRGDTWYSTSSDGLTWPSIYKNQVVQASRINSLIATGSIFVLTEGYNSLTLNPYFATSSTGLAWTEVSMTAPSSSAWGFNGIRNISGTLYGLLSETPSSNLYLMSASSVAGLSASALVKVATGLQGWDITKLTSNTAFPAGLYTVVSASGNVLSVASPGATFTSSVGQTATPITVGVVDVVPDTQRGLNLYTSDEGITQQNDVPPDCIDMVRFRNTCFYAAPMRPPTILCELLSVSGSVGAVQIGDTVSLLSGGLTASAAEDFVNFKFLISTGSTDPNQNIRDTVASLVRVVCRNQGSLGSYAVETSAATGHPGSFALVSSSPLSGVSVSFTGTTTAWSPQGGQTASPKRDRAMVAYSKPLQPDSVPVLNSVSVGNSSKSILRVAPLRDAVLIFKEDGVFRLTGQTAADLDIQPLFPNLRLVGLETPAYERELVFALTSQGFVAVSDTDYRIISFPIDDQVQPLLNPDTLPAVRSGAFGVSYEADRTYLCWAPSGSAGGQQAFVYNWYTDAWTKRTDLASIGIVHPADNRLWLLSGSNVRSERKSGGYTDFADETYTATATLVFVSSSSPSDFVLGDTATTASSPVGLGDSGNPSSGGRFTSGSLGLLITGATVAPGDAVSG